MNDQNFFTKLIRRSIEERWCVQTSCTTCGSGKFKSALFSLINDNQTKAMEMHVRMSDSDLTELLNKLREISPMSLLEARNFEPAMRFILYHLWLTEPSDEMTAILRRRLGESFAGQILEKMHANYQQHLAHLLTQDPAHVAKLRAQKKANKQIKHAERMRLQQIRKREFLNMQMSKS